MKVGSEWQQRLDLVIADSLTGEVTVVERQSKAGCHIHQTLRLGGRGDDRADVRFNRESDADLACSLNPPCQLLGGSLQGVFVRLILKWGARQQCHVTGIAAGCKFENAMEELGRSFPDGCVRMIDGIFLERAPSLSEDICDLQIILADRRGNASGSLGRSREGFPRIQMGASREQRDIDSVHSNVAGQPQRLFPFKLGKAVVARRESQFHRLLQQRFEVKTMDGPESKTWRRSTSRTAESLRN